MLKRIISAFLALSLVSCAVIFSSADTLDDLKNKQNELQAEADRYQSILNEKEGEIAEQEEYVDALTGKVASVTEEISVIRSKMDVYDSQITEKTELINQLNLQAEDNMNMLRKRLKAIYISGDASTLEIILGAKDFSDFVDKIQLVDSLNQYDSRLIDNLEAQLDGIGKEIDELNAAKAGLETENTALASKLGELNSLLSENEEVLKNLYTDKQELDEIMDSNHASQNAVEQEIEAYYEELRRQEEAQKPTEAPDEEEPDNSTSNSSPDVGSSGGWVWPVPGYWGLSSSYGEDRGYSHGGIDIAEGGIMGAQVVAAASGTVISSCSSCYHNWGKYGSCGCGGGYGNYVWIDHGDGKATIYAHMSSITAYEGQYVSAGQTVGYVGSTGYSTGPHLHFEARYYGTRYDPMSEY